jgi:hypothetical protein
MPGARGRLVAFFSVTRTRSLAPEKTPEARASERATDEFVLGPPRNPLPIAGGEGLRVALHLRLKAFSPFGGAAELRLDHEARGTILAPAERLAASPLGC